MRGAEKFMSAALAAAREAGKMLKAGMSERRKLSYKGTIDLVTDFDDKAQDIIHSRLAAAFPGHGFLGEEGLSERAKSEFVWIFDPLDGTTNYAHRFPIFSVSISLEHRGKVILGVVYDPMRDEMFQAAAGEGAHLNGKKIRVSKVDDLNKSLLATGFPYDIRESPVNNIDHFNNFILRAQAVRRCGSAAMDLCYVACGRFDGFWELKLKPWDMAAGGLIVREARGRISDFDGEEFSIYKPNALASNGLIHEAMIKVLQIGKFQESKVGAGT